MSGIISAATDAVNNVNRTVHNTGTAMDVASNEMPRFNQTVENTANAMDNQASQMNQTAANTANAMDNQAGEFNQTFDVAAKDWAEAVSSMTSTSQVINDAIEMWSPSMDLFLTILGPLQLLTGVHYLTLILKSFGVLPDVPNAVKKIQQELHVTNTILQDMSEGYREVEAPGIVQNITKSSIVYDESSGTIEANFFFSDNNIVVKQLKGLRYFAYDTMSELFKKVFIWNAFADTVQAAAQTDPSLRSSLSKFDKRRTNIHFLDPRPKSKAVSHIEFTKIHKNVTVINHYQAIKHLTFESVKVHGGCSVRLEHVTVGKIDATLGGKAHLHRCLIGWNQVSPSLSQSHIPFLFLGKPDEFNNPYNVCGSVSCHESTTYARAKKWKIPENMFAPPSNKQCTKGMKERTITITNISDAIWSVKFEPGFVSCNNLEQSQRIATDSIMILPLGGEITFTITKAKGGSAFFSKGVSGALIFIDNHGEEYTHRYKGQSNLPDFTIVCPAIARGDVTAAAWKPSSNTTATWLYETCSLVPSSLTTFQFSLAVLSAVSAGLNDESMMQSSLFNLFGEGSIDAVSEVMRKSEEIRSVTEDDLKNVAESRDPVTEEADDKKAGEKYEEPAVKKNTILVVGRFGSGKSTFLNTLAGVHWKLIDGEFVVNKEAARGKVVEKFPTSYSVRGCTQTAVAHDMTTFDGRELTVIDTVGYEDTVNAESFYSTKNKLTEVMDQYDDISAVVIVLNSSDSRLTQGFVESLACVPKSFKKEVRKNIVLVFTNWHVDDENSPRARLPDRGFSEQVKVIRMALGFGVDGNDDDGIIPAFWMDNRPFKEYNDNARNTCTNLFSFLNHVAGMPQLSCKEFKEMRALSQFERSIRKAFKQYFQPSNENHDNPSGFEKFLFECAGRRKDGIKKVSLAGFTAKNWSGRLIVAMQQEIKEQLPKDIERICDEVAIKFDSNSSYSFRLKESMGGYISKGLINGGVVAIAVSASFTLGFTLLALPGCAAIGYGHSKTWSRKDVISRVVFGISKMDGERQCSEITDQISSHVDDLASKLQDCFASFSGTVE